MSIAEPDTLEDIFFGEQAGHGAIPAGDVSLRDCVTHPCDICDNCDKQALARAGVPHQGLRHAATSCDTGRSDDALSQNVAACRKGKNTQQTQHQRGLSQKSQMSQGPVSQTAGTTSATATTDPDRLCWRHSDAMNGAELAAFTARRDRLIRWGYPTADADALADRLTRRDRDADDRVTCTECRHHRPGRCGNHKRAALASSDIGRDLATLLQRCEGFTS